MPCMEVDWLVQDKPGELVGMGEDAAPECRDARVQVVNVDGPNFLVDQKTQRRAGASRERLRICTRPPWLCREKSGHIRRNSSLPSRIPEGAQVPHQAGCSSR